MVNQQEAISRLNKEKEYEDSLVDRLGSYFLISLDSIQDISDKEKNKLKESLSIIQEDSTRHSYLFNQLVQLVFKNESDNF
ncbi:MAG: hypothetical protein V1866_01640 [archaeon]